MIISCLGGGPAGLYTAILFAKAFPDSKIRVFERNKSDDTFGWGVVFSDETLSNFAAADPESFAEIERSFAKWTDIVTWHRGTWTRSTGHGFCGLSRKRLLQIFHERARSLGVSIDFQREIRDVSEVADSDLVVAADGIQSAVRTRHPEWFRPSFDWRKARFTWLGTTKPLTAFTFVFLETEWGVFQVHAYPFQRDLSTWIVECHESTWKKAGLEHASEADTLAFCERICAPFLDGHKLLANRSIWRAFPTIRCESWHHGNVVLLGDAVHTAHFSIGSGTKLAMEDAIALVAAFQQHGTSDVPRALAAYEASRRLDVLKLQRAAQTSLEWFESTDRLVAKDSPTFTFDLMTRSKRITYDNLAQRDPALVRQVTESFGARNGARRTSDGRMPPPAFAPLELRDVRLANRIVVSPMCQYSARDGVPNDWHLVHLGSRAVGGAGLVFTEMTNVSPEGRITPGCAGMWNDEQCAAWKRVVDFVHASSSAKVGMQIAHAGRKGSCNLPWEGDDPLRDARAWQTIGPSAIPFDAGWPAPREMTRADMERVRDDFVSAVQRADRAGFDAIELHMAHGYLLSSFLSPLSNRRDDAYGGSLANRMRFPLEVLEATRAAWPRTKPLFVRISASDWLDDAGGFTIEEAVVVARELASRGCDVVDVSSAGNVRYSPVAYGRMYQVPFADRIRGETGVRVMAVGGIQGVDHVNTVVAAGRADLCALARPHLLDPQLTLAAAARYGVDVAPWPKQYLAVRPKPRPSEG